MNPQHRLAWICALGGATAAIAAPATAVAAPANHASPPLTFSTTGHATDVRVAIGPDGATHTVWSEAAREPFAATTVRYRRVVDGVPGPELTLSDDVVGVAHPTVTVRSDGTAVVLWVRPSHGEIIKTTVSPNDDPSSLELVANLANVRSMQAEIDADDVVWVSLNGQFNHWDDQQFLMKVPEAGPVSVVHTSNDFHTTRNVAALSDTQMHMAWLQTDGATQRVTHTDSRLVDFDVPWSPRELRYVSQPGVDASDPQVGSTADQARFVWVAEDHGHDRVFERTYEPGTGLGPIRALSPADSDASKPRLSVTGDTAHVTWISDDDALSYVSIDEDDDVSPVLDLTPPTGTTPVDAQIASNPNGDATVARVQSDTTTGTEMLDRVFVSAAGVAAPALEVTPRSGAHTVIAPSLAEDQRGFTALAWHGEAPTLGQFSVHYSEGFSQDVPPVVDPPVVDPPVVDPPSEPTPPERPAPPAPVPAPVHLPPTIAGPSALPAVRASSGWRVTLPGTTVQCATGCETAEVRLDTTRAGRTVTVGRTTFRVAANDARPVTAALGNYGRRLLARVKQLRVTATVTLRDATGAEATRTATFTLRAPSDRRARALPVVRASPRGTVTVPDLAARCADGCAAAGIRLETTRAGRRVTLGRSDLRVPADGGSPVDVALSASGQRLLARVGSLRVTATLTLRDAAGAETVRTVVFTLRPSRR